MWLHASLLTTIALHITVPSVAHPPAGPQQQCSAASASQLAAVYIIKSYEHCHRLKHTFVQDPRAGKSKSRTPTSWATLTSMTCDTTERKTGGEGRKGVRGGGQLALAGWAAFPLMLLGQA